MADPGDLTVRLASLGSDLGSAGLPGPAAARVRARQRTRRYRAGAIVVVAAVATGLIASPRSRTLTSTLERGFAFVQDTELEVHPDDSPRE